MFVSAILCLVGMTFAAPSPHTGMINTDHVRDVGAVYAQAGFGGEGKFLLQVKDKPACMPLDANIASVQICVNQVCCILHSSSDCGASGTGSAFLVRGQGDVHELPGHLNGHVGSYQCGPDSVMNASGNIFEVPTTPHDSSKDLKPGITCLFSPCGNANGAARFPNDGVDPLFD